MTPLTVYYDYTCSYSYKALHWFDRIREERPDFELAWSTFSLKEVNRAPDDPSPLDDPDTASLSVVALALAHAAREADFDRYHRSVFEAMHADLQRLTEADVLRYAAAAGVDVEAFNADRAAWIARLAAEHRDAAHRLGVYGTPTLIVEGSATFVRLREVPATPDASVELLDALNSVAGSPADLVEISHPEGPKPVGVELGKSLEEAP